MFHTLNTICFQKQNSIQFAAKEKKALLPNLEKSGLPATSDTWHGSDRCHLQRMIVPNIEQPLYQWVGADGKGMRNRQAVPKGLGLQHSGFADGREGYLYHHYFLVDPDVSEPLLIRSSNRLHPNYMNQIRQRCEEMDLFKIPLANPKAHSDNVGRFRIPWLRKEYGDEELKTILQKPVSRRDGHLITSFISIGSAYKQVYSNFWWLRDSEIVAFAFANSRHPDPKIRKQEHRLGARMTLTNLAYYTSRSHNLFVPRAYDSKGNISTLGAVRVLIDDQVRDQIRAGHWDDHTIHIRERMVGDRLDERWPQLQFDALGLHLAALATHLKERNCLKWNALDDQEKEAVTILYAYMLRLKYWDTPDSGPWEFDRDGRSIRSSSVGMATHGMRQLQKLLFSKEGEPIREWMRTYLTEKVLPLAPANRREALWDELVSPLAGEAAFEQAAVAPGFRRLYHQLPFESLTGVDPNRLDDEHNLHRPYHPDKNPGYWDSAVLFLPRYAPDLLDEMPAMRRKYFAKDTLHPQLLALRNRYARGVNAVPAFSDTQAENTDYAAQILNSNQHQLWRRSGIIRYFGDAYQNLALAENKPGPFCGKEGQEPEWSNFPPMHATAWFTRYLKSGNDEDFLRGVDAWNLSISSLSRFTDIRNGEIKFKWAESVRPAASENDQFRIATPQIPDLLWTHAEAKAMWEAFQQASVKYARKHLQTKSGS